MGKRILVADDEPDIVRTISIMLESEGYEVVTALEGEEAVKKAFENNPDLLILDMLLPGINGTQVAAILKKDTRYSKVPVVLITAQAQKSDEPALKAAGADFYMIKPFDLYALKDKVEELLRRQ
ncbi:MAG: response regulator [Candidatus Omnitrophota bacterium]